MTSSTDPAPAPPLHLRLLDVFDLRHDGRSLPIPLPAQRLLAFLALHHGAVHRRVLAGVLWADLDDRTSAARLRSTLWRLPTADGRKLVDAAASRVELSDAIEVDLQVVQDDTRVAQLRVEDLAGEVLADWDDDWVHVERERFRQVRLRRLEQLSDRACSDGDFGTALQAALGAVAVEPLRESAHRRVMRAHLAEANPAEALRQYEVVRRLLRDALGIAPTATTRDLVAPLLGRPLDRVSA
jgi:DNA-binding SARP family transcriptional activator